MLLCYIKSTQVTPTSKTGFYKIRARARHRDVYNLRENGERFPPLSSHPPLARVPRTPRRDVREKTVGVIRSCNDCAARREEERERRRKQIRVDTGFFDALLVDRLPGTWVFRHVRSSLWCVLTRANAVLDPPRVFCVYFWCFPTSARSSGVTSLRHRPSASLPYVPTVSCSEKIFDANRFRCTSARFQTPSVYRPFRCFVSSAHFTPTMDTSVVCVQGRVAGVDT